MAVHKGVKYSCDQCDCQANQQGNFKNHKLSVHETVKYNQCDYQPTQMGNLKYQKLTVHEGVKYN